MPARSTSIFGARWRSTTASPPAVTSFPSSSGAFSFSSRRVRIVNDSLEFRDQPDYLVPLARLQTPLQILGCVSHLMTKPWITPEATRAFIAVVCDHRGIRMIETA